MNGFIVKQTLWEGVIVTPETLLPRRGRPKKLFVFCVMSWGEVHSSWVGSWPYPRETVFKIYQENPTRVWIQVKAESAQRACDVITEV